MECGICYNDFASSNDFTLLSCKHSICHSCYDKLLTNKCPYCRKNFVKKQRKCTQERELEQNDNFQNYRFFDEGEENEQIRTRYRTVEARNHRMIAISGGDSTRLWYLSNNPNPWEIQRALKIRHRHHDFLHILREEYPEENTSIFHIELDDISVREREREEVRHHQHEIRKRKKHYRKRQNYTTEFIDEGGDFVPLEHNVYFQTRRLTIPETETRMSSSV